MLKQGVGFSSFGVVLGIAVGYLLWGIAPLREPAPLPHTPTPVGPAATDHDVAAAQPQLPAVSQSATDATAALVRDNQTEDIKLPAGLAWHPPKSLMPDFFVPDAKPFTADTYQQALQQLDRADAELFEQLNQSVFGSFDFNDPQQYQTLLRLGMPTTEELRYVYSKPLELLLQEQRQLRNQLSALYQGQQESAAIQNYNRLIALIKNRAADEMLAEYRQYNAGYQTGEPITEQVNWPAGLVEKHRLMKQAYAFSMQPGNVVNQIAMFKIEQQLHEGMPARQTAIWLGVMNRNLPDFVSRYGATVTLSDEQKELVTLVSTAIN